MSLYEYPDYYDADPRPFLKEEESFILHYVETMRPRTVCDVGCGTGRLILRLLEVDSVEQIVGIDCSYDMLRACMKKIPPEYRDKIVLIGADVRRVTRLPSVDLALCSYNFLQHFVDAEDWMTVLSQCFSMLDPGGEVIVDLSIPSIRAGENVDFEVAYQGRVLRRRQIATGADSESIRKRLVYEEVTGGGDMVRREIEICFAKIKWDALYHAAMSNGALVKKVQMGYRDGRPENKVVVILKKPEQMWFEPFTVNADYYEAVWHLASVSGFLRKTTWREDLPTMLVKGLASGKWTGIGIRNKAGELIAYLDYRVRDGDAIEIGACMTARKWRNSGLMKRLFGYCLLRFYDKRVRIGTYESNAAMRGIIRQFGFREVGRKRDRINGEHSIYYERAPFTPFEIEIAASAAAR